MANKYGDRKSPNWGKVPLPKWPNFMAIVNEGPDRLRDLLSSAGG